MRLPMVRLMSMLILCVMPLALTACYSIDRVRTVSDRAAARYEQFNLDMLVEAETERQRIRRARCYSPVLSPGAISAAAVDARLGGDWVEELLGDCPQFASFVSDLVLRRARQAGLVNLGDQR